MFLFKMKVSLMKIGKGKSNQEQEWRRKNGVNEKVI